MIDSGITESASRTGQDSLQVNNVANDKIPSLPTFYEFCTDSMQILTAVLLKKKKEHKSSTENRSGNR